MLQIEFSALERLWCCYHIYLFRIKSSRGNISFNTTGHGCHLQAFFTISCFSINVTSTYIENCNLVSERASKKCVPQGWWPLSTILVVFQHIAATSWDPASQNSLRVQFLFIVYTNITLIEHLASTNLTVFWIKPRFPLAAVALLSNRADVLYQLNIFFDFKSHVTGSKNWLINTLAPLENFEVLFKH